MKVRRNVLDVKFYKRGSKFTKLEKGTMVQTQYVNYVEGIL